MAIELGIDLKTCEPVKLAANEVMLFDSDQWDDATAAAISEVSHTKDGSIKI